MGVFTIIYWRNPISISLRSTGNLKRGRVNNETQYPEIEETDQDEAIYTDVTQRDHGDGDGHSARTQD